MKYLLIVFMFLNHICNANAFNLSDLKETLNKLNTSNESSCDDVDLRNESIGENRNQGSIGWCFAYASADLVTNKVAQKVSAVSLAFLYYEKLQPDVPGIKISKLGGGNDQGVVSFAQNEYCLEEDMPSSNYSVSECNFNTNDPAEIISNIESFLESKTDLTTCQNKITKALFKNLTDLDIGTIAKNKSNSTYMKMLTLNKLNCQNKKLSTNKIFLSPGISSSFIKDIDTQLDKQNPVSINYNAGFLLKNSNPNEMYNHYSTIFGRRLNKETKSCEYLIRNTWGTNCSVYPEKIQGKCEDGSIWVDKDTLNKNLMSVTSIK